MHLKRSYWLKARQLVFLFLALILVAVIGRVLVGTSRFIKDTGLTPAVVVRLIFDTGSQLKSNDDRTNVLILGIGGGQHEGADLTDTMLVLSINQRKNTMALVSVPRDIWSDTLKDKINSAYHYGEEKKKGGGMILSRAIVEDVVGLPIHYAIVVDFSGFKKVIDLVGGVTINVPQAFTDNEFPIEGKEDDPCGGDPQFRCRYQTISFDMGVQRMTGERALAYVRSRHAEGDEGSDFARNRRQQDLLVTLKSKLVSPVTWLSPWRDIRLLHALDDATDADMTLGEFLTVGRLIAQIKSANIQKISFADLLETPPLWLYDGKYVLVPKEDFAAVHAYVASQLK